MMANNEKQRLQDAIALVKAGDKDAGGKILVELLKEDPQNELAWLWISTTVDDLAKKEYCLKKVLQINPANVTATNSLRKLQSIIIAQSQSGSSANPKPKTDSLENSKAVEPLVVSSPDLKKCPFCAETIKAEARVCRFCRRDLVNNQTPVPVTIPAVKQKRPRNRALTLVLILILICSCLFSLLPDTDRSSSSQSPKTATPSGPTRTPLPDFIGAKVMCEEFVREQLRSPTTAEFPYVPDNEIMRTAENEFLIISYVDAQNAFGAMLRTYYSCHVRDNGLTWFLLDLTFEE